ncbi:hypothetical protein ADUPG1_003517, partial [Aduncisulcus paluster]
TSDQAMKYTYKWDPLRSEMLEEHHIPREKESKMVDCFVDGIKPEHFKTKIKEAVALLREQIRSGRASGSDTIPDSDTLEGLCAYFTREVQTIDKLVDEYKQRLGHYEYIPEKKPASHSDDGGKRTEMKPTPGTIPTFTMPRDTISRPTRAFQSERGFGGTERRRELHPKCVFCGYSNHWAWECRRMSGRGPYSGTKRLAVTKDAWRHYGQIVQSKRPELMEKFT